MAVLTTDKPYLTVKEAAEILRVTKRDRIYLLLRSGVLKGFQFGNKWLIDREYFETWCESECCRSYWSKYPLHKKEDSDKIVTKSF